MLAPYRRAQREGETLDVFRDDPGCEPLGQDHKSMRFIDYRDRIHVPNQLDEQRHWPVIISLDLNLTQEANLLWFERLLG